MDNYYGYIVGICLMALICMGYWMFSELREQNLKRRTQAHLEALQKGEK